MLCLCNGFTYVHSFCSCGMSCFIPISRKGPAGAGRRRRRCKYMLFIIGRGRREPVGGEDGVNICCSL